MRKNFASRALGLLPFFLVVGPSCSLVYDLSPDQCGTNDDCAHFGEGMTCEAGICTCTNKTLCSASTGGSAGKSGSGGSATLGGTGGTDGGTGGSLSGTGGDAGMIDMGGTSTVGGTGGTSKGGTGGTSKGGTGGTSNGGTGNTGNEAGAAGGMTGPECTTHLDCFTLYPDDSDANPRACVQGTCVPLKTDDCPIVLPYADNGVWSALKSTDAIIVGGFGPISGVSLNTYTRNYDLALSEFSQSGGVFAGSTKRHQVVMVLCKENVDVQADLLPPAKHLIEELQVPAVVAALKLEDQHYVWENEAQPNGTFMIMPLYNDESLVDAQDDGLIWNMLSRADALSVTYQPLIDMTVDHLKLAGVLGSTDPVKISQVEAMDEPFLADTGRYIDANLQFNGQSTHDNLNADPPLYDAIAIQSSNSAPPSDTQTDAISRILSFKPHIVIGSTADEMLRYIIPGVESGWDDSSQPRPFYILGALDFNDSQMMTLVTSDHSASATPPQTILSHRILGINWPSAVDQTVDNAYLDRWKAVYSSVEPGYENFYDPVYYLLYGIAAARLPLTGVGIVAGLQRVISTTNGTPVVDVGPGDDMDQYISLLSTNSRQKIELVGTMGPPNWDEFGARNDPGSVWCVNSIGVFQSDQMRFDAGPPATLTGEVSPTDCFTFDGMQ